MRKERQIYIEKYRKGLMEISENFLPQLMHTQGCKAVEAHLLAAGVVDRGGERLEFQDIRVYLAAHGEQEK